MNERATAEPPPEGPRTFGIFVSYRRGDSGHAGRLYDALAARFGADSVFMDVDAIDPGVDFAETIDKAVASSTVLIALIGRGWITATDPDGRRRLDNPRDFVRLEIESALERDVLVIPACVQGTPMPDAAELPPSLATLAGRQSVELRDVGWRDDVSRLIRRLEELAATRERGKPSAPRQAKPARRSRARIAAIAAAVLAIAAAVAVVLALTRSGSGGDGNGDRPSSPVELRLLSLVSPVLRAACYRTSDGGPESAQASISCGGAHLNATYNLFSDADVMRAWYVQQREEIGVQPDSGTCTADKLDGERPYAVGGRTVGRYFCEVDSSGESELTWSDSRVNVAAAASTYSGLGPTAAASLLRQWRCCLELQPPG